MSEPTPDQRSSMPVWGWAFVAACVAIPVVALGGAIPGALGAGGAAGCYSVARQSEKSVGARVAICTAIVAGCWAAFIALLVVAL